MKYHVMPRQIMRRNALKRLLKRVQKEFGKKDLSVLEIGYGSGYIFNMYAGLGLKPFGYDFSEKAYNRASQQKAVKNGNAVLYKSWDEVPLASFDVVVACEILEHCEDDLDQLSKWVQYLNRSRGGAALILSVPAHPERWDNNDVYSGHYRRYTKEALQNLMRACNMKIASLYTYDFPANLALDRARSNDRKKRIDPEMSYEERTKGSGVIYQSKLVNLLASPVLWVPVAKLQQLFYRTDWGSAYILLAYGELPRGSGREDALTGG